MTRRARRQPAVCIYQRGRTARTPPDLRIGPTYRRGHALRGPSAFVGGGARVNLGAAWVAQYVQPRDVVLGAARRTRRSGASRRITIPCRADRERAQVRDRPSQFRATSGRIRLTWLCPWLCPSGTMYTTCRKPSDDATNTRRPDCPTSSGGLIRHQHWSDGQIRRRPKEQSGTPSLFNPPTFKSHIARSVTNVPSERCAASGTRPHRSLLWHSAFRGC